jgi:hypothetical protein
METDMDMDLDLKFAILFHWTTLRTWTCEHRNGHEKDKNTDKNMNVTYLVGQ